MANQVTTILRAMCATRTSPSVNAEPVVTLACKINPIENKFIIPTVFGTEAIAYVRDKLLENLLETELTIVKGLAQSEHDRKRTALTIIREFINIPNFDLVKIETNKGDIYYGNRNIILDSNFHPLFMPTVRCSTDGAIVDRIVLVDPIIFTRKDIISNNLKKDAMQLFDTISGVLVMPLGEYVVYSPNPIAPAVINRLVQWESSTIAQSLRLWE